ncbi:MAG: riboflavin synthase [Desulfobacterales bacterium]
MFTGIIEGMGAVTAVRTVGQARRLAITADFALEGTRVGDSIAVSGACLTAVMVSGKRFEADVSPETIARTTFAAIRVGERVNLERALRFSDRLDGHLVAGHIDGVGTLKTIGTKANATILTIGVETALARYMIEKGSVAVDGISLTINRCAADRFEVSIIPHTALATTLRLKKVGAAVNIEADMIGKYVERFLTGTSGPGAARRFVE